MLLRLFWKMQKKNKMQGRLVISVGPLRDGDTKLI